MEYKVLKNGLWQKPGHPTIEEIEKAVKEVFGEKPKERTIRMTVSEQGMRQFQQALSTEVTRQMSELEQLEYLDRLSEQIV